ncbi:hypothetical protein ABH935_004241 [Catenulispora sp. GAS73]
MLCLSVLAGQWWNAEFAAQWWNTERSTSGSGWVSLSR